MSWWQRVDQWIERAVLRDLGRRETHGLHAALLAVVSGSLVLAYHCQGQAAIWLFWQLALLTFFKGRRWGLSWLLPTWCAFAWLQPSFWDQGLFAVFCLYAWLIAGVTVSKYRLARRGELQLSSSLEMARQVQLSLQPPGLVDWGWASMASCIVSARHLGGDLVCWQRGPQGSLYILVGDVMGKGAQAALTAAYVKGLFDELAVRACGPRQLLLDLHAHLAQRTAVDSFLAALAIQLDVEQQAWRFCRAGLPSGLLQRRGGHLEEKAAFQEGGMMLGIPVSLDLGLKECCFQHCPGDRFFLASDGLCEEEQLPDCLEATLSSSQAWPLPDRLQRCVQQLLARDSDLPQDDQTAVLLEWP